MMTRAEVTTLFLARYGDCPPATAALFFTQAYRELIDACELRKTEIIVSLVAWQREYTLDAGSFDIYEAYYQLSNDSGNWRVLNEFSRDKLATLRKGWIMQTENTQGGPIDYYVSGASDGNTAHNVIGFDPPPDTTTAGGYPRVKLYANTWIDLDTGDTLPSNILTETPILCNMFTMWSRIKHRDHLEQNILDYERELQKTIAHVKSNLLQSDTQFIPNMARRRGI